ncbi:DUF7210 family protein [Chroococcidiopsis sp.]|uniref:DUF7210 family protein n=1 Tax=Chroococcidiopsis sp. TaxID=3088168 RepID=UPI003F2A65BA
MSQYKALTPLQHNGKPVKEGATIEMSQEDAESLIEMGAIAPLGSPPPSSTSPVGSPDKEDTMIVTQQVSDRAPEEVDVESAPISTARKQQQKKPEA